MEFDYPKRIGALGDEERLRFYELLAHNLTVSVRAVWSYEQLSDARKVEAMKCVNEIMHHVIKQSSSLRLRRSTRSDADVWEMIKHWSSFSPDVPGQVGWAIKSSYKSCRAATSVEKTNDGAD